MSKRVHEQGPGSRDGPSWCPSRMAQNSRSDSSYGNGMGFCDPSSHIGPALARNTWTARTDVQTHVLVLVLGVKSPTRTRASKRARGNRSTPSEPCIFSAEYIHSDSMGWRPEYLV